MANAQWPDSLPGVLRSGYGVSGKQAVIRTQMETGLDEVSRISSTNVRDITAAVALTDEQCSTFWSFYHSTEGANDGANLIDISIKTSNGFALHACRIKTLPRSVPYGTKTKVSFTLETDQQIEV